MKRGEKLVCLEEELEDLLLVVDVSEVEDRRPVPEKGEGRQHPSKVILLNLLNKLIFYILSFMRIGEKHIPVLLIFSYQ